MDTTAMSPSTQERLAQLRAGAEAVLADAQSSPADRTLARQRLRGLGLEVTWTAPEQDLLRQILSAAHAACQTMGERHPVTRALLQAETDLWAAVEAR